MDDLLRVYSLVISLKSRSDRRKKLENMRDLELYIGRYKYLDAFPTKVKDYDKSKNSFRESGVFGCTLSHRTAIEFFKLQKLDYGIVCEDDIDFNVGPITYSEYLENRPKDWDILAMGRERIPEEHSGVKEEYEKYNKYFYRYKSGVLWGAHCYYIRSTVYDYIIDKLDKYDENTSLADVVIYDPNIKCYIPNYSLVRQIEDYSDNHGVKRDVMSGRWRADDGFY